MTRFHNFFKKIAYNQSLDKNPNSTEKDHMVKHKDSMVPEGKKMPNCTYCGKDFKFKSNLTRHVKKIHNDGTIIPNILQNSQNDNVSQPLQEISHDPASDILPYISLNSQNHIISEPLQDITSNPDPVIEIASNPSFEQNTNIDENIYKYN